MADSTKQDNPEGFGEYTWCSKPVHEGSNAMFSLVNTPMFEQEAPTCFVTMAYEPDQEGYAQLCFKYEQEAPKWFVALSRSRGIFTAMIRI